MSKYIMVDNIGYANGSDTMIDFTPYLDEIGLALASGVLAVIAYAKIAVKNITPEEAEAVALRIVAAMADGSLSAKEKQDIVVDIIKCMRTK